MERVADRISPPRSSRAGLVCDLAGVSMHPGDAREAFTALAEVAGRLRLRGDARACFPGIYAIVTRRVVDAVEGRPPTFFEPRWISRLSGRFCERYLETLAWSLRGQPQDAGAWHIAYEATRAGRTLPIQDVMLGLSAHINFDLAIGISQTLVELGIASDPRGLHRCEHDHFAVNDLLRASMPEALDHLAEHLRCPVSQLLSGSAYPLVERIAMELLRGWRTRVWGDALALLAAQGPAREPLVARLDLRARRIGKVLALPLLPRQGVG